MLGWALTFLILALVAGYMGFFGLAGLAATDRQAAAGGVPDPSDRQRFFRRAQGQAADLIVEGRLRHAYSRLPHRTSRWKP